MRLFDRYVVVDWSAASVPKRGADSIWIATLDTDGDGPELANPATRREAESRLTAICTAAERHRTLIAIDASLGYPEGTAALFGVAGAPWRGLWRLVHDLLSDDGSNRNDRFEVAGRLNERSGAASGPFWGCPHQRSVRGLSSTKPRPFPTAAIGVDEFRACERWLRAHDLRPASCWQLLGAGSVGGQTLTLLPILERLVDEFAIEVWPFTTGWTTPRLPSGGVVVAETWPTAFEVNDRPDRVRDANQVHDVAMELGRADRTGDLPRWFAPPDDVAAATTDHVERQAIVDAVEREEGWVLMPRR